MKHDSITGVTSFKKFKFKKIHKFNALVLILLFCLILSNIYQYRNFRKQVIFNVKIIRVLNIRENEIVTLRNQIQELNNKIDSQIKKDDKNIKSNLYKKKD